MDFFSSLGAVLQSDNRIILDIHTHHPAPQPEGIVAVDPADLPAGEVFPRQLYSVGLHPWSLQGIGGATPERLAALRSAAQREDVVAIGETGVDTVHPGMAPMAGQLNVFKAHVELSEQTGKALVIHCVKGQDMILGVKRTLNPKQSWIIHGFRGKPSIQKMLTDAGCYLSFGPQFNPDSLKSCPAELILAETDETPGRIEDVIGALNAVREDVTPELIRENTLKALGL